MRHRFHYIALFFCIPSLWFHYYIFPRVLHPPTRLYISRFCPPMRLLLVSKSINILGFPISLYPSPDLSRRFIPIHRRSMMPLTALTHSLTALLPNPFCISKLASIGAITLHFQSNPLTFRHSVRYTLISATSREPTTSAP